MNRMFFVVIYLVLSVIVLHDNDEQDLCLDFVPTVVGVAF